MKRVDRSSENKITIEKIKTKTAKKKKVGWYQTKLRNISPYFTWLFLKAGVSANQATVMSVIFAIIGALFFLFKNPAYWILAWVIMQLYPIIDCVDGEIARYKRGFKYTKIGIKFDEFMHPVVNGIVLIFATFGLYFIYQSFYIFVFGFVAVFFMFLNRLVNVSFQAENKLTSKTIQKTIHGDKYPLGGLVHIFLVPSLLDTFFSNFRLLFLILLGISFPLLFIQNMTTSYKFLKSAK